MAKVKLNPMLEELHGKLGEVVFRRTRKGGISLIRRADMSGVKWSPAQKANRQRFSRAVAYARSAMQDPALSAKYEKAARRSGRRAFEEAVSDYLKKQKE
ncbi:MAG: hypothetical protein C3F07_14545 [Anaerolineales bacterium]|nr:hypothetical protein [Anaerolineae bacterium]PWB71325.1 MAG: hypothetical protein C3F07_14545 [Anaerolineales bacterium]